MSASGHAASRMHGAGSAFRHVLSPDVSDEPKFQALLDWWNRKRAGRPMPLRADLDPVELRTHLKSLVLIECLPGLQDFRYRLIGSRIVEAYGRDNTGRTVRELYAESDPVYANFLLKMYRDVAEQVTVARGFGTLSAVQRPYRRFDTLLLPLARPDGSTGWLLKEVRFD